MKGQQGAEDIARIRKPRLSGVILQSLIDKEVADKGLQNLHVTSSKHERKALTPAPQKVLRV
jgi:hypothetical protein